MEEPDLTLSTSDISTTETDLANLTLEEKDSEAQSSFQVNPLIKHSGFLCCRNTYTEVGNNFHYGNKGHKLPGARKPVRSSKEMGVLCMPCIQRHSKIK